MPPRALAALPVWFKIGCLSFGGPAAQIALMQKEIVDERGWADQRSFVSGLNFAMLLPGPEAQQLAAYLGWRLNGLKGALMAGGLFVLPGALVMLALSILYVRFIDLDPVQWAFTGIKAAVAAILIQAMIRLGGRLLTSWGAVALALGALIAADVVDIAYPYVVIAAALIGVLADRTGRPLGPGVPAKADAVVGLSERQARSAFIGAGTAAILWLVPLLAAWALTWPRVFVDIWVLMSTLAVVTFGGAYAVLSFLADEAVGRYAWLSTAEMVDALGLAESTPGPTILVIQHVAFLAGFREAFGPDNVWGGVAGAALATWVTFAPCFLWILLGAPFIERMERSRLVSGALAGVGCAVVGVIAGLGIKFGATVLMPGIALSDPLAGRPDPAAWAAFALAALLLFALKRGAIATLLAVAAVGIALRFVGL